MARPRVALAMATAAGVILASVALAAHLVLFEYTGTGSEHLGGSLAFGDVSGDGTPDVVIGADAGGSVRVYDGTNLSLQLYEFVGAAPGDAFGSALAVADLNGDLHAEVVVGAPSWDGPAGNDVGYVAAFDGATGTELFQLQGQKNTDVFGSSLALGDVTGDGTPDLLVGAPFADLRGTNDNRGYVALFSGATRAQLFRWDGAEHFDEMGRGVAIGDVNADGVPDLVLGAGSGGLTDYGCRFCGS